MSISLQVSEQKVAGLDTAGVETSGGDYLATVTFRASEDAAGEFSIDLLYDENDPHQRTFLFPTRPGQMIDIVSTSAAVVSVR